MAFSTHKQGELGTAWADRFDRLIRESSFVFTIGGNAALDSFEIRALAPGTLAATAAREDFVGLVGFRGLLPRVALAVELDDCSTQILGRAIVTLVESAIVKIEQAAKSRVQTVDWREST